MKKKKKKKEKEKEIDLTANMRDVLELCFNLAILMNENQKEQLFVESMSLLNILFTKKNQPATMKKCMNEEEEKLFGLLVQALQLSEAFATQK